MKLRNRLALMGALLLLVYVTAPAETPEVEIKRVFKNLIDAENKHDLSAVRALCRKGPGRMARILGDRRRHAAPSRYVSGAVSN
jgi:hypothetical protein